MSVSYAFGWGRRFCLGSNIVEAALFIAVTCILWCINLKAPVNSETGVPAIPDIVDEEGTFTDGFLSTPRVLGVSFKPRSEMHDLIIRESFEDAQSEWLLMGLVTDGDTDSSTGSMEI